ncbi:spondin domain-containing protein [bacterium]|nr:spondin domain-containing protein [bacterium]
MTPLRPLFLFLALLLLPALAAAELPAWASYTATFDATWSATTHPQDFPANAHWSGLIGGTHDDQAVFWAPGTLATTGVRQMAEWGATTVFTQEVDAQIIAGHAGEVVAGPVLWESPGQTTVTFTVTPDHPLITLCTMIAPSPDWFAGVNGLDLRDGDVWRDEVVVDLYPYDAGTDSGASFASPDLVTSPPVPVAAIAGAPFTPGVPVATLTFRRDGVAAAPVPTPAVPFSAVPNPFNPATELRFAVPEGTTRVAVDIADARGRIVRRLAVDATPGERRLRWDGRTDAGRPLPSGVYFARLALDGTVAVRKLVLVQ